MQSWLIWLLWLALAYLAGSIPFGLLLGYLRGVDIRELGSGNIGATNLGREVGPAWGIGCFALDVAKGAVPVLGYGVAAGLIGAAGGGAWPTLGWLMVAGATMAGHIFPPWLGFKGGKGVATGLGAVLGLYPMLTVAGVLAGALWVPITWVSGYVSVGSMLAALALPVLAVGAGLVLGLPAGEVAVLALATLALAGLVVWRHRSNLQRLREGTEGRVSWGLRKAK